MNRHFSKEDRRRKPGPTGEVCRVLLVFRDVLVKTTMRCCFAPTRTAGVGERSRTRQGWAPCALWVVGGVHKVQHLGGQHFFQKANVGLSCGVIMRASRLFSCWIIVKLRFSKNKAYPYLCIFQSRLLRVIWRCIIHKLRVISSGLIGRVTSYYSSH